MKKRILTLMLTGVLGCAVLAGCTDKQEDTPAPAEVKEEVIKEEAVKEEKKEEEKSGEITETAVDTEKEEKPWTFLDGIRGNWSSADDDAEYLYLTVYERAGTYLFDLENPLLFTSVSGTVDISLEQHPDGSRTYWYCFIKSDGSEWASFPVNEDDPYPADLYSGQDGAMHYIRTSEAGGMGDVAGYFFTGVWECGDYTMEVFDNGNDVYFVTIEWAESEDVVREWEYLCTFDAENQFLFCDNGTLYIFETENGELSAKHQEYADGSVNFYFEDGAVVWADHVDPSHQDMRFEFVSE